MSRLLLLASAKGGATPVKTVMLLHADGTNGATTFQDAATGNTITGSGGDNLSSSLAKFGTTGMGMVVAGAWTAPVPASKLTFGLTSFTVEFFMDLTNIASNVGGSGTTYLWPVFLWGGQYSGSVAVNLGIYYLESSPPSGGSFGLVYQNASKSLTFALSAGAGLTRSTYVHVAFVSVSGTVTMYLNGVATGGAQALSSPGITETVSTTSAVMGTAQGASGLATWSAIGGIDEFRISNVARYTSNFTPPSSAFTID